jgi:glycosyltransferase involved in cell wall biosynthesis
MGLPVISTDAVGAAADYVIDGVTGLLVRSGDSKAMADALCRLLTDLEMAAVMGQSALQFAAGRSVKWAAREFVRAALTASA